jgi:acetylornithine/N-succinyldiaminopimelate aminotransferase
VSGGREFMKVAGLDLDYHLGTYARKQVLFVKGEGMRLTDDTGKEYLDFVAGIGSVNLGHAHPAVTEAVSAQMSKLVQVSNLYYVEHRDELAAKLVKLAGGRYKTFFCNSGTEASEGAIKFARAWGRTAKGPKATRIVCAAHSFHGRTLGALAATGQASKQAKFGPLPEGFDHVAFNDAAALEAAMGPDVCAIMLEPVQGEGGVHPAAPEYLKRAKELADAHNAILVLDEVQTGFWRTGPVFASVEDHVKPDIMTLAKALANGLPAGAVLVSERVAPALSPGDHGSTFAGGPVIAAAALATIKALEELEISDNSYRVGDHLRRGLTGLGSRHAGLVKQVRGRGLMNAIEFNTPLAPVLVDRALDAGLVLNNIGPHVLRFLPPLVCDNAAVDLMIARLDGFLSDPALLADAEPAAAQPATAERT